MAERSSIFERGHNFSVMLHGKIEYRTLCLLVLSEYCYWLAIGIKKIRQKIGISLGIKWRHDIKQFAESRASARLGLVLLSHGLVQNKLKVTNSETIQRLIDIFNTPFCITKFSDRC